MSVVERYMNNIDRIISELKEEIEENDIIKDFTIFRGSDLMNGIVLGQMIVISKLNHKLQCLNRGDEGLWIEEEKMEKMR